MPGYSNSKHQQRAHLRSELFKKKSRSTGKPLTQTQIQQKQEKILELDKEIDGDPDLLAKSGLRSWFVHTSNESATILEAVADQESVIKAAAKTTTADVESVIKEAAAKTTKDVQKLVSKLSSRGPRASRAALILEPAWLSLTLSGQKTWELRKRNSDKRNIPVELIEKGSGLVRGCAWLRECTAVTIGEVAANLQRHRVPLEQVSTYLGVKITPKLAARYPNRHAGYAYKWSSACAYPEEEVVKADKPNGAMTWVRLA